MRSLDRVAAMWRAIPVPRPLGRLARMPMVPWGMEGSYLAFPPVRPRLTARMSRA